MVVVVALASISGCIVSCGVIYRGLIRPIYKWATRLERTMDFVEMQMKPNGGSSMRDALNRIESRLTLVEEHITKP